MTRGVRESREQADTTTASTMRRLRNTGSLETEQIREQAIRPRHSCRELPKEAQTRVDVRASAQGRDEQSAFQLRARRVVRLEQRDVGRVPVVREVQAPLLHPAAPVIGTDLIRIVERRVC